jgi:hypothetical protein
MPNGNTSPGCWPGCTGLRACPTRVADPVAVCWHDCGFEQAALCILRDEPATNFTYTHPADNRDWMRADQRFLRACGVRPPDVRKDDFTRRGETL